MSTEISPDTEILLDCSPLFRQYKSGRVERLMGTDFAPAGLDSTTGVTTKDQVIDTVTGLFARLYLPELITTANSSSSNHNLPVLIYIHGGAFCIGSATNPNPFLNSLVAKARFLAVSIDYRLAPEHLLPTAYEDCWAALKWVMSPESSDPWLKEHADRSRVFLMGESAGANIAHYLAMRAGTEKVAVFEGLVLGHPYFWGTKPVGSESTDLVVRGQVERLWKVVNKGGVEVDDPWINPIAEKEVLRLSGLGCRRVMVCVGEKDVLVERGRAYAEALKGSGWGGEVDLVESDGEGHVFFYYKPECEKAVELREKMVGFFKRE